jgi:hypothetical protein
MTRLDECWARWMSLVIALLALRGAAAVGVDASGAVGQAERWRTSNRTALRAALLADYDATDSVLWR